MKHFSLFIFLLLSAFTIQSHARQSGINFMTPFQNYWTQSFYTDDSQNYLELSENSFKQKIRVDKNACDQIKSIEVIFKDPSRKTSSFKALHPKQVRSFYGINTKNYCWYEVTGMGINLNRAQDLKYVLKITDLNDQNFFFKGIISSLIPSNRLTDNPNIDRWIDLGSFGVTPITNGGVFYKIWEPLADKVELVLNQESPRLMQSEYLLNSESRFHYLYLPHSKVNDYYHYQFYKNGKLEVLEVANFHTMSAIKVDPMAKDITYEEKGGRFNGYINPRGVITKDSQYFFKNDSQIQNLPEAELNNWIIYQLWPLTFNPQIQRGAYTQGRFIDILAKIPYLKNLGINTVEFLPINEGRFNASWGYALDSLLAIEKTLGTREELKQTIDALHQAQIKVLLDVVINHINNNLLREPFTDGTAASKFYSGDTPWGPKPRFESVWVRKWIIDSLVHFIEEYHIDGYRFDMTDSVFNGSPGGAQLLQELNYLLKVNSPNFYSSAEQLPDNVWVTNPLSEGGLGFDSQWNDRFKNFFELEFDNYSKQNRQLDLKFLKAALEGYSDHEMSKDVYYHFGPPKRTVNYLGSHDFVGNKNPFLRIISGYRSTEVEDHNHFERVNPLEEKTDLSIPFRQIHNDFTHSATRTAYGILFTKPGAVLFYQGEEFAQDLNLENEWAYVDASSGNRFPSKDVNIDRYVRSHRVPWYYFELGQGATNPLLNFVTTEERALFKGHFDFFKKMIQFRKDHPDLNDSNAFNIEYASSHILTYTLQTKNEQFFVVVNFGNDLKGQWITFPSNSKTWWEEVINSSDPAYGSQDGTYQNPISQLGGRKNLLRIKGPSFSLYQAKTAPTIHRKLYLRGSFNQWNAHNDNLLKTSPHKPEELSSEVNILADGRYEFKIGSNNWDIDLGAPFELRRKLDGLSGTLTTVSNSANVLLNLKRGSYIFTFNINTYKYSFKPL